VGFYAEVRLLYLKKDDEHPENKVWMGREAISFGHVTRLEKLADRERYRNTTFDAHQKAGICVTSIYLQKLYERLETPKVSDFAPPVLIRNESWDRSACEVPAQEYVDLRYVGGYRERFKELAHHNTIVACEEDMFIECINRCHIILDQAPVMWESCATLVGWLDEAEGQQAQAWQELEKDPVSLALARAWRSYFREVSAVGARALFWFPRY
jgi:hypothetical protein